MAVAPIIIGDAKITVRSLIARVFEALVNQEDLRIWWSPEAVVEADVGGRYETSPAEGRQEGTIVGLEAPRKLSFTWPIPHEESMIQTTMSYDLTPQGPKTTVHVSHRAPRILPHDWNATWRRALESLKRYLEREEPSKETGDSES